MVMSLDFAAIHRYFPQKSCGHHQRNSLVHVCLLTLSYVAVVSATLKAEHQLVNATIAPNIIIFPSQHLCALTYKRTYKHTHTHKMCIDIAYIHNGKIREVRRSNGTILDYHNLIYDNKVFFWSHPRI